MIPFGTVRSQLRRVPIVIQDIVVSDANVFAITVDSGVGGDTAAGYFKIPSDDTSYNISWEELGDANHNSNGAVGVTSASHVIDFGTATATGKYLLLIDPVTNSSSFDNFRFNNLGDKLKVLTVEQWGTATIDYATSMFRGCSNMTAINSTDLPDLTGNIGNTLSSMFRDCSKLANINRLSEWVIPPNTNLAQFIRNTKVNQSVGDWDISAVTDMGSFAIETELSTVVYDDILIKFAAQTVQSGVAFRVGGTTKYTNTGTGNPANDPAAAKAALITAGWTFIDGGEV